MSHNKNTSRIKLLSDFRNISIFTFGFCSRSYDLVVRMLLAII